MDPIITLLTELGFAEVEARLYLAALELGTASASDIARKADIQRTYFYDLSKKLLAQGLLKRTSRGKKEMYQATDPSKLIGLQETRLERLKAEMPRLQAMHGNTHNRPRVFFYEGLDGLKQVNEDSLTGGGELVGFTTPLYVTREQRRIAQQYAKSRASRGTHARAIGEVSTEMRELQLRDAKEKRETRMLPQNIFSSAVEIFMHGDKVFVTDYRNDFGFVIECDEFAKTMKRIFEIVWNSGKVIEAKK